MDRRQFLAVSAGALTTASAGCTNNVLGNGSGPDENPSAAIDGAAPEGEFDGRTIEVSTSGEVEAEPDTASVSVGVEASGDTADEVNDELAEKSDELRTAIEEFGVPEDDIESGRYDIRDPRNSAGFEGTHSYQIELDDPDEVGEFIDTTTEAGADDVGRVNFGLTDETRAELRDEALDEALANADDEAAYVAQNRDVEITGTSHVSTTNVDVTPHRATFDDEVADDADTGGTELDSGLVSVSADATVVYSFE